MAAGAGAQDDGIARSNDIDVADQGRDMPARLSVTMLLQSVCRRLTALGAASSIAACNRVVHSWREVPGRTAGSLRGRPCLAMEP